MPATRRALLQTTRIVRNKGQLLLTLQHESRAHKLVGVTQASWGAKRARSYDFCPVGQLCPLESNRGVKFD